MGTENWCNPGRRIRSFRLGKNYSGRHKNERRGRLQVLWRRIKGRILKSNASVVMKSYDPVSYSKNFDEGLDRSEADNLSRSFSARFADSSRRFYDTVLLE